MARRAPSPPPAACLAQGAAPPREPAEPASKTTIDGLDADTTGELLLRFPSSLSLVRAAAVCRRWRRLVSETSFLPCFRDRHPSSPFMGVFVSDDRPKSPAKPLFLPVCSDRPVPDFAVHHRDMATVACKSDFTLARLEDGQRWHLRDCRNGVLLLSGGHGNSMWVYDPVSQRDPLKIQPRPDEVTMDGEFLADCLLDGPVQQCGQRRLAVECFRVVSVQQQHCRGKIRAVEYDPDTLKWRCHPWASPWVNGIKSLGMRPMYAASRIFWKYDEALLFVLNTRTMVFSTLPLPWKTISHGYSIGEIEDGKGSVQEKDGKGSVQEKDGKGYLVCIQGLAGSAPIPRLQVWELHVHNALDMEFKLKEEVPMRQVLGKAYSASVCGVRTVTNGLAVLNNRSSRHHFVVDLRKMSLLAEFECRPGSGYPYQMPWPPIINSGSTPPPEDTGIGMDDGSARIQLVETDPSHDEPTLPMAGVFPSPSCDRAILEDRTKSSNLTMNTTEDTETLEQQYTDTTLDHLDDQMPAPSRRTHSSHAVHDISGVEAVTTTTPAVRLLRKRNNLVRVNNLTDEEPGGQRKKLKTKATSNACPEELVQHMPSPSRKMYMCDKCGKTFKRKYHLERHEGTPHGLKETRECFTCDKCGRTFNRKAHLKGHEGTAHSLKETPLTCRVKGCTTTKKFYEKYLMAIHEESGFHFEDGKVKCTVKGCEKKSYNISDHNSHFSLVHQERLYACTFPSCDKKCPTQYSMVRHVRQVHTPKSRAKSKGKVKPKAE